MNQSSLTRHTPLKATTGLPRGKGLTRKPIERKRPELRVCPDPEAAKPAQKRPRDTGPRKKTRDLLTERSGGVCEICGRRRAVEAHHRHGRKAGGTRRPWINDLSNLLHVDRECHQMVTNTNGHRQEFEHKGWLLREGQNPALTPVVVTRSDGTVAQVWLTNAPGYSTVPPDQVGGVAA